MDTKKSTYLLDGRVHTWVWILTGAFALIAVLFLVSAFTQHRLTAFAWAACALAVGVVIAGVARVSGQRRGATVALDDVGMEYRQGKTVRFVRWDDVSRVGEADGTLAVDVESADVAGRLVIEDPGSASWGELLSDITRRLDANRGYSHRLCENRTEPTPCANADGCGASSICQSLKAQA